MAKFAPSDILTSKILLRKPKTTKANEWVAHSLRRLPSRSNFSKLYCISDSLIIVYVF